MENPTVLITGATSGIGLEFTKLFHLRGFNLVLASRSMAKLELLKKTLAGPNNIAIYEIDFAKDDSANTLFNWCSKNKLIIDILINNAGAGYYGEHIDIKEDEIDKLITLNITTPTKLCKLFGKQMKDKRSGYILNVASTAGFQPLPYFALYASSKSYLLNFSIALAKELEEFNVVVTSLNPGSTQSNFFNEAGIKDNSVLVLRKDQRMPANKVAQIGFDALFKGKLSVIPGWHNKILIFSNRLVSKSFAATIAKWLMKNR